MTARCKAMNPILTVMLMGAVGLACERPARAGLALTQAGVGQNLGLTTFVSGFPNSGIGPLGTAFTAGGGVLVSDYNSGSVYRFGSDADGQVASAGLITANYGANNPNDMAQLGGGIFMTRQATGDLVRLNQDGTLNQVIVGGLPSATGLVADPSTGKLFVSTIGNGVIYEVDPFGMTKTPFLNANVDGLTLSPDGATLYGAGANGHILGFSMTTRAEVFDSGFIPGGLDGTAVGTGPIFSGLIFANTNSGQVFEINLVTLAQTLIATGGSRGDFVTVDPTNNTLLITQSDRIIRLNGAPFTTVPEPSSLALCGIAGAAALAVARVRRRWGDRLHRS